MAAWRILASMAIVMTALSGCIGRGDASLGPPDVVLDVSTGLPDAEFAIGPDPLRVTLGNVVELRVANGGAVPHTYTIHEFDVDTGIIEGGGTATLTFRADRAGSFEIVCDVPGHYADGMKATLIVA